MNEWKNKVVQEAVEAKLRSPREGPFPLKVILVGCPNNYRIDYWTLGVLDSWVGSRLEFYSFLSSKKRSRAQWCHVKARSVWTEKALIEVTHALNIRATGMWQLPYITSLQICNAICPVLPQNVIQSKHRPFIKSMPNEAHEYDESTIFTYNSAFLLPTWKIQPKGAYVFPDTIIYHNPCIQHYRWEFNIVSAHWKG